jgi:hypothetical protein
VLSIDDVEIGAGAGIDDTHDLPASRWKAVMMGGSVAGCQYSDPKKEPGPIHVELEEVFATNAPAPATYP